MECFFRSKSFEGLRSSTAWMVKHEIRVIGSIRVGADSSVSIHLFNETYLWLWGDSLIGSLQNNGHELIRNWTSMPHSALAYVVDPVSRPLIISRIFGDLQLPAITGDWIPMENQILQESFDLNIHLVPMSTIGLLLDWCFLNQVVSIIQVLTMHPEKLLILAQVIIPINNFELIGTDIILISNPFEVTLFQLEIFSQFQLENCDTCQHPSSWNYTTRRIPTSSFKLTWQTGVNMDGCHVIFIGCSSSMEKQPLVMSRIL